MLALGLLFGGILLIGLAADVARLVVTWQEVSHVAHTSAEVGAGWVDPGSLYEGRLDLDRGAARAQARAYLEESGLTGVVRIQGDRVCVTARSRVRPGIIRLVGAGTHLLEVTACAEPRQG